MTKHCNNRAQFPSIFDFFTLFQRSVRELFRTWTLVRWSIHRGWAHIIFGEKKLVCHGVHIREKLSHNYFSNLVGTILVVFIWSLDKRESIDVAHIGLTFGSQHIEAANILFKTNGNSSCYIFFLICQIDRIAHFLALTISVYFSVKWRTFAGLCMSIVRANCVNFDVKTISRQELLINVGSFSSDLRPFLCGEKLRAKVINLPK